MGEAKVVACADYFAAIAPWVEVEPIVALFGKDVAPELLAGASWSIAGDEGLREVSW